MGRLICVLLIACQALLAPGLAFGDESTAAAEKARAPLRAAYAKAKQAEKDALAKRQAALDRVAALLKSVTRDFDQIRRQRATLAVDLDAARIKRKQAVVALDIAMGRHNRDRAHQAVIEAQRALDAIEAVVSAKEKELARLESLEADKVRLPSGAVYTDLLAANIELDRARKEFYRVLGLYVAVLRPPPPPFLQSVRVFSGSRQIYHGEWRVDGKAADVALRELTERLDQAADEIGRVVSKIEEKRDELRQIRADQLAPMRRYSDELVRSAADAAYAEYMKILGPAIIEGVGVLLEVAVTGGGSTLERFAVTQAQDLAIQSGTRMVGALQKKAAGKALTAVESKLVAEIEKQGAEQTLDLVLGLGQTAAAKFGSDNIMTAQGNALADALGFPDNSAAINIVASDLAEQLIQRVTKSGTVLVTGAVQTLLPKIGEQAATTLKSIATIDKMKGALAGELGGNLLAIGITTAKAIVANYYEQMEQQAKLRFAEAMAGHDLIYQRYYLALRAERSLQAQENALREIEHQIMAYRLATAGPRALTVHIDDGIDDIGETLTFALRFSQPISAPPIAHIGSLVIDMKAKGANPDGSSAYWEGEIAANKFSASAPQGVLDVSLPAGSRPYAALDSNPVTAARFIVPEAFDHPVAADRREWDDFERGPDRNHRIKLRQAKQQDVPWLGRNRCEQINCDCGAVAEHDREPCAILEAQLRRQCAERGQTYLNCPPQPFAGPNAFPKSPLPRAVLPQPPAPIVIPPPPGGVIIR